MLLTISLSVSVGVIIGLALYSLAYHLHPMRKLHAYADSAFRSICRRMDGWRHPKTMRRNGGNERRASSDTPADIPEFLRRDMRDGIGGGLNLDFLEPDYVPTPDEQAYLDMLHPKDAEPDAGIADNDAGTTGDGNRHHAHAVGIAVGERIIDNAASADMKENR